MHITNTWSSPRADEPAGDCLKWDTVFHASGYADEFGSKEKFVKQRDDDIALAGSFTKACAVWLSAKNEGRRCRARSDGRARAAFLKLFWSLNGVSFLIVQDYII